MRKSALCGLPDCDCDYTISKLLGALERLFDAALVGVMPDDWESIKTQVRTTIIEVKRE